MKILVIRQFIQHPSPPLQPQALVVYGGVGISGKVNINDNMDVSSCLWGVGVSNVFRQPVYNHANNWLLMVNGRGGHNA
jgi:hypothetical protein